MPAPDPSRNWIALGSEAAVTVASTCLVGWWLSRRCDSPFPLLILSLLGVGTVMWRMLRAAK